MNTPLGSRLVKYSISRDSSSVGWPLRSMKKIPIGGITKVITSPAKTASVCPAHTARSRLLRSFAP